MNAEAKKADLTGMLDSMDLNELRELRKNVDRAISSFGAASARRRFLRLSRPQRNTDSS